MARRPPHPHRRGHRRDPAPHHRARGARGLPLSPPAPAVALLTDFGLGDVYVGVMKAVILGIAPDARPFDLAHGVPPQDVTAGAFALAAAAPYLPPGTIVCAVVDPGVGGPRRAVAVRLERPGGALPGGALTVVAPDNGLLTMALADAVAAGGAVRAVSLDAPAYRLASPSATFHGRDLFAPACAHLAAGVPLADLGAEVDPATLVRLEGTEPRPIPGGWRTGVLWVDHFGTLVTGLRTAGLEPPLARWRVALDGRPVGPILRTFSDVAAGEGVAYPGSSGFLELAVRDGSATRAWGVGRGAAVEVRRDD